MSWIVALVGSTSVSVAAERVGRQVVRVQAVHPRAPDAYTQGLLWYQDKLYESTGQFGESKLRRLDPRTGNVEAEVSLGPMQFGEGLARVENRLYQLTWRSGIVFVYDLDSLEELDRFSFEGEGWGLCFDGRRLVMSDGSDELTWRDPLSFEVLGRLNVTLDSQPVDRLNELECVEGWIYANVYHTESIVRIDPESGAVDAVIDASGLLAEDERAGADVLNGIAFDPTREVFYLTGKYWPRLFEVTFVPATGR
jgi:glutaminyl-peptide cyclotransferase